MMKYFEDRYYIKKDNGRYFLNPRVSLKGQKVMISTVLLFIDEDIAKYYYETNLYYEAFEDEFNNKIKVLIK